ncbi:MAG: hypothetical protein BWK76_28425 [Desulfobulbaceae bacterium A2]|nr:MAG: hypothetical protein BWK76_28425 [Desulfobulbaceae bacterium A2]
MAEPMTRWELTLDQPGSADATSLRRIAVFTMLIAAIGIGVVAFGSVPLAAFPQFAIIHAGFVFLLDAITSFVLFGQFRYRRRPSYAILAGAYLFSSLVSVPFLLAFPGACKGEGGVVIGASQSAIWIWHLWHILFPILITLSLLVHRRAWDEPLPEHRVRRTMGATASGAVSLVIAVTLAVTVCHDDLPPLINGAKSPLTSNFYVVGAIATLVTAFAMAFAWRLGWQRRTILHLWLAATLTVCLADVAASLGAYARYTVGWYFGRIESMIAASVLLLVFLGEVNRLYRHIADALEGLSLTNDKLRGMVEERDALVAQVQHSEEQVRQLAYYDPLTDLPNRRLLLDRMQQALSQARRHHYSMAIMFLDLDRFKQINDTLGHEAGDELLRLVAQRLLTCVRSGDTVSRSGGDEFIVLLAEISQPQDAALVAKKIGAGLSEPLIIGTAHLQVTTSIGIAIYPIDGTDDVAELMKKADTAMYAAKEAGRSRYRFYGGMGGSQEAAD